MNKKEDGIVQYIEPVFHFCLKHLGSRQNAEDLAGKIMVHVLYGIKKYKIDSLKNWVWRITHNRCARFINTRNKNNEMFNDFDIACIQDNFDFVNDLIIAYE